MGNTPQILAQSPDGTCLLLKDYREDTNKDGQTNYLDQPQLFILDLTTMNMQLLASGFSWAEWLPDSEYLLLKGYGVYIIRYDGTGKNTIVEMDLPPRSWFNSALSPDASQIAYIVCVFGEDECILYCVNIDGTAQRTVTTFPNDAGSAYVRWLSQGDWMAVSVPFPTLRRQVGVFSVKADGSTVQKVFHSDEGLRNLWGMPDSPKIGFAVGQTCFTVNMDGTGLEEMSFLESLGTCIGGEWSPDRRQFATTSPGDWSPSGSTVERLGLYVLNLDSGRWRQILSGYSVDGFAWLPELVLIP